MVKLTSRGKEALDNLATRIVQESKIPGFIFGASTVDDEVYFKAGGYKVVNEPSSGAVDEESVFWICSMTKLLVHLAALQLIEQGKFTQDTPVSEFFPDFANPVIIDDVTSPTPSYTPAKTTIRVKHLLNFSSGLFYPLRADEPPNAALPLAYVAPHNKNDPHSEFFKIVKGDLPGIPIKFEPGTDFAYGYSSDILGFIVEKVSGKTLDEYLQDNIFKPLEITASFYLTPDLKARLVALSFRQADGSLEPWTNQTPEIIERDPTKVSLFLGGVGLYASLRDYLSLLRHLLQIHSGKVAKGILTQATVHELFIPVSTDTGSKSLDLFTNTVPGSKWSTALAICTTDWPNRRKKGSAFWSGWAGTYFFMDPTTGITALFGTQIIPSRDPEVIKLYAVFEETLYSGLEL